MAEPPATDPARAHRPEFLAALNLLARALTLLTARGAPLPILVGGAVVEFDTVSAVASGDFDLVSAADGPLTEALLAVGFRAEARRGRKRGGFYHPELPIGVELVSGAYFDGAADRTRVRFVALPDGDVVMAPTEDLIADRLGQWVASGRRDAELLTQATALLAVAEELDAAYLDRRIRQDTAGEIGLAEFRVLADDAHHPG